VQVRAVRDFVREQAAAVQARLHESVKAGATSRAAQEAQDGAEADKRFEIDRRVDAVAAGRAHEAHGIAGDGPEAGGIDGEHVCSRHNPERNHAVRQVLEDQEEHFGVRIARLQPLQRRRREHCRPHLRELDEQDLLRRRGGTRGAPDDHRARAPHDRQCPADRHADPVIDLPHAIRRHEGTSSS
jgi:hypothetical protein